MELLHKLTEYQQRNYLGDGDGDIGDIEAYVLPLSSVQQSAGPTRVGVEGGGMEVISHRVPGGYIVTIGTGRVT